MAEQTREETSSSSKDDATQDRFETGDKSYTRSLHPEGDETEKLREHAAAFKGSAGKAHKEMDNRRLALMTCGISRLFTG